MDAAPLPKVMRRVAARRTLVLLTDGRFGVLETRRRLENREGNLNLHPILDQDSASSQLSCSPNADPLKPRESDQ